MIEDPEGKVVARLSEYLGRQTNNYAEYKGLLAVLAWALENRCEAAKRGVGFRADGAADEGPVQGEEPGADAAVAGSAAAGREARGF